MAPLRETKWSWFKYVYTLLWKLTKFTIKFVIQRPFSLYMSGLHKTGKTCNYC